MQDGQEYATHSKATREYPVAILESATDLGCGLPDDLSKVRWLGVVRVILSYSHVRMMMRGRTGSCRIRTNFISPRLKSLGDTISTPRPGSEIFSKGAERTATVLKYATVGPLLGLCSQVLGVCERGCTMPSSYVVVSGEVGLNVGLRSRSAC